MSKTTTKEEYLNNIRAIINEGMADAPAPNVGNRFTVRKYIAGLLEAGHDNPKLMDVLIKWDNILKESGNPEYLFYEDFYNSLKPYAKGAPAVKNVISQMRAVLEEDAVTLEILTSIANINDPVAQTTIGDAFNEYLEEPTGDARREVIEACWELSEQGDAFANRIITLISDPDNYAFDDSFYSEEDDPATVYESVTERVMKIREEKKKKRTQAKLEEYAKSVFEAAEQKKAEEKERNCFAAIANNTGINLSEAIKTIVDSDARKNRRLMDIVEQYAGAVNAGLYEERLYETFIHNLTPFNYLLPVEKAINAVNEAVKKNPIGVAITKVLEEMAESQSCNILPLIEEDCARYVNNPNPTNRVQLRNCLVSFAHDPFVNHILEIINNDNSKEANSLSERAMSIADEIKLIKEHAHTENIYSPVQFIKEGESVFYANGQYFVRKGQNIAKIGLDLIQQLPEKFTALCKLVNDPAVELFEDHIILHGNEKTAKIYEGYVEVNGNKESVSTLRNLQEMGIKYDYDTNFFVMCSCLLENFNNIAKIDFGRRIVLNENARVSADLFRVGDNIFIHTVNEDTNHSTFYHNVNPIQCKNIINDHMGLNVSNLFESLLPAQNKIIMRLNETQNEYTSAIERYETTIENLKKAKDNATSEENIKKIEAGIATAEEKLKDIKAEYKEWQKSVEIQTGKPEDEEKEIDKEEVNGDGEVKKETTNEPLDDKDVDNAMADLTTPISDDAEITTDDADLEGDDFAYVSGEEEPENSDEPGFELSDEEFDKYLNDDDTEDTDTEKDVTPEDNKSDDILGISAETVDDEDETEAINDFGFSDSGFDEFDTALGDDEVEGDEENSELYDDDIDVQEPAESVSDDEDIITDEPTEDEEDGDAPTALFGGDTKDPLNGVESEPVDNNAPMVAKIANITFDQNIKDNQLYRTGTVTAIIPMVAPDGNLYNDSKTYNFYLNDAGEPVVDNEEMPYSLYTAIVDNIKADKTYVDAVNNGVDKKAGSDVKPSSLIDLRDDNEKTDKMADDLLAKYGDETSDEEDEEPDHTGIEDFFDVIDTDNEFSVTPKDDFKDILDFNDDTEDEKDVAAEQPENSVVIPTYNIGDTEVELPAPDTDGTAIPESKKVTAKKKINESKRSLILGIKGVEKHNGFFVNEGTVKPSSKPGRAGNPKNGKVDGASSARKGYMIENHAGEFSYGTLEMMRHFASDIAYSVAKETGDGFNITDIASYMPGDCADEYNAYKFDILRQGVSGYTGYTVYGLTDGYYMRPVEEFENIIADLSDEVPGQLEASLSASYTDDSKEPVYLGNGSSDDYKLAIRYALKTMSTPVPDELLEHAKGRRPKLSPDHRFLNTKMVDDILHGDEEQRDFEENVEKDTQEARIENPLAPAQPAQEEAFVPKLPNIHKIIEEMKAKYDIIYEPNDKVIYKKEKMNVISVSENGESVDVMGKNGQTMTVSSKDLEPDPEYINDLNVLPNAKPNDPDTPLKNEKPQNMKDLNAKNVECNIIMDRQRINMTPCMVPVTDIKESKKALTVINEDGLVDEYSLENVEFTERPYAVIIDSKGEPIRKIQVDPASYINAGNDDMVVCYAAGKETSFPKRVINILS